MNILKKTLRFGLALVGIFLFYVVCMLLYGTLTDFQPEEKIILPVQTQRPNGLARIDTPDISILNWNIGYSGLGDRATFFYDDGGFFTSHGKMVRSPETDVKHYWEGIKKTLQDNPVDFYLLQEVDTAARRSYYINQMAELERIFPAHNSSFGINFSVGYVPLPLMKPWDAIGYVQAGLLSLCKYAPYENTRYQYPGTFAWPTRIFNLDRCMSVHKIQTRSGKDLILINSHNSAYDADGGLRRQEMAYLKKFVEAEYAKGNYVIVGADWNQCPPNYHFETHSPIKGDSTQYPGNVPADFLPAGWTWAVDTTVATHRDLANIFDPAKTSISVIDYYLLSPNVQLQKVKTIDQKYAYSDHQPILLQVKLLGL
jgi:endonuclease/exonuclease/phosphatase family metal-dependent hydrolase